MKYDDVKGLGRVERSKRVAQHKHIANKLTNKTSSKTALPWKTSAYKAGKIRKTMFNKLGVPKYGSTK